MAKFQSPLLGYNNNVRHRGRVFHVQTEDSGVNHPHIITHLFMDGGRILKSVKKSYAEHVGSEGMSETVRVLMKEQHKAMLIALRDGQFDELVDPGGKKPSGAIVTPVASPAAPAAPVTSPATPAARDAPAASAAAPAAPVTRSATPAAPVTSPAVMSTTATRRPPAFASSTDGVVVNAVAAAPIAKVSGTALDPHPRKSPPIPPRAAGGDDDDGPLTIEDGRRPMSSQYPSEDTALPPEIEALLHEEPPARRDTSPGMPSPAAAKRAATIPPAALPPKRVPDTTHVHEAARRRPAQELTLDFDALERDAHLGDNPMFHTTDLPPPPKNLFAKEPGTGTYSAIEGDTHDPLPPSRPPPVSSRSRRPSARPSAVPRAAQKPSSEGRYAPARPAATFGATPKQASPAPSIFSEDLVSDKSLDEVILSYLAEDLDPTRRK